MVADTCAKTVVKDIYATLEKTAWFLLLDYRYFYGDDIAGCTEWDDFYLKWVWWEMVGQKYLNSFNFKWKLKYRLVPMQT